MKPAFLTIVVICLLFHHKVASQPYLDIVNLRFTSSPDAGIINRANQSVGLKYYNVSTTLPLLSRNKNNALIFSPYFEHWRFDINERGSQKYYGFILPVSVLRQLNTKWNILLTGIMRLNDSIVDFKMRKQFGGALLINYKSTALLTYKFGAYVNGEFFGLFFMPLLGIDWQINNANSLFGVLPGNLTFQHRLGPKTFLGATFRAQTNSYNKPSQNYLRVDENQLGGFIDLYLQKHIVLNIELGQSILRQLRTDNPGCQCNKNYVDYNTNDNIYFKVALAYRIALRK